MDSELDAFKKSLEVKILLFYWISTALFALWSLLPLYPNIGETVATV
jgi:hypothetical protein